MKAPIGFDWVTTPYMFQYEAFVYGINNENAGLLYDLGLGKTKISIDIMRYRIQFNDVNRVLVVCPTSILYNWQKEIALHSEYTGVVLHGTRKERIKKMSERHMFYIINYEALWPFIDYLRQIKFDAIVFDETARYLKTHNTRRTRASIILADKARYKLMLTATPIANRPLDLWSQFRILDGGKTFGRNFWKFRKEFFYELNLGKFKKFVLKKEYHSYITAAVYSVCIRKKKEECIDLPEQIFQVIPIKPDSNFYDLYDQVSEQILAEIETEEGKTRLTIDNILTKLLRLQQITSGFTGSRGEEQVLKTTPKLDAVVEEVEAVVDSGESVVIWCRFLYSIQLLAQRMKKKHIKCITMSGADGKDKYSKWKGYQESKDVPVFIGQVESGGIGIELFKKESEAEFQHMFFYENSWSMDVRIQATGRIHRIGQASKCIYKDFIIQHTIDQHILGSLNRNQQLADILLEKGIKNIIRR